MATEVKKEQETVNLTPYQEEGLKIVGDLYRQSVYSGKNLPEVLDIFISLLLKQEHEMCQTIVSEIVRYKKVVVNRKFFRTFRSQIDDLYNRLLKALPKDVSFTITCRRKSFESALKKILLYYLEGNSIDLTDLIAFRVIVDSLNSKDVNESYCYSTKDICMEYFLKKQQCTLCKPLKQVGSDPLVKDYIEVPKKNGYKSIHLALKTQYNDTFEVQIRDLKMHEDAEIGKSAHTGYKDEKYKSVEKHIWFDSKQVNIPNFRVLCNGSIYDKIGLKNAMHIEERSKTF